MTVNFRDKGNRARVVNSTSDLYNQFFITIIPFKWMFRNGKILKLDYLGDRCSIIEEYSPLAKQPPTYRKDLYYYFR